MNLSKNPPKTPSSGEGMNRGRILSVTSLPENLSKGWQQLLTENVPQREQSEKPKPRCADEAWDTRKGLDTFGNERVSGHMSGIGAVSEPASPRFRVSPVFELRRVDDQQLGRHEHRDDARKLLEGLPRYGT